MMAHAFIEIYQQAIPGGVPLGCSLEVHRVEGWEAGSGAARARNSGRSKIRVLESTLASGVMDSHLAAGVGLVHVEEAAQMNAFGAQEADIERRFFGRLKFKPQAGLDSVRGLVVLIEPHDYGVTKEAAAGDRAAGAKAQRSGVRISSREHAGERNLGNVRRAGEGTQPR